MRTILLFCALALCVSAGLAVADAPRLISYQGVLTNESGAPLPDGSYDLTFRLYEGETGGSALWTEPKILQTSHGVFNHTLGSVTALTLAFDRTYYLGVTVGGDPELSPRTALTSSPYAIRASAAEAVVEPIPADMIQPDIISSINSVTNDGGNINLVAGPSIAITPNDAANTVTIGWSGPDWTHEGAVTPGNEVVFTHNLGGDASRYLVMMDGREAGQYYHQSNFGTNPINSLFTQWIGAEWCCVTASTITVRRGNHDDDASVGDQWDYIRVRIWKNQ
jgi:hypothetical protein